MEGTRRNARRGRNKISVKREAPGESFDNEYGIQKHWKPSVKQEQPSTDTDTGEMCGGQFMPNTSVKSEVEEWGRDSDSGIVEESPTEFSNKLLKEQELELESDSGISEEYAAQASTKSGHTQSPEDMLLEKEIVWQFTEDTYSTCDPLAIDEEQQDEMQLEVPTKEEQEEEEQEEEQEQELDYGDVADVDHHYEDFQTERGTLPRPYWGPRVTGGLPSADPSPDGYAAPPPDPFPDGYAAPPPDQFPFGYAAVPPDPPTRSVCENPRQYRCLVCERWFTNSSHLSRHYKTTVHQQTAIKKGVPALPSHKTSKRQRSAAPETPPPSECVGSSPDGTEGDRGKQPELRHCAAQPPLPEVPPLPPPQPPPEVSPAQLQPPESSPVQLQPPESSPVQLQPPESSPVQLQPPEAPPPRLQPPEAHPPRLPPPGAHPPRLPPPGARPPRLQPPEAYLPRLPPPGAHPPQLPPPGAYPPQLPPPGAYPPQLPPPGAHPPPPLPPYVGNSYGPQVCSPTPQLPGAPQPTSDGGRTPACVLQPFCPYVYEWQQHAVPGSCEAQLHQIAEIPHTPEHALALQFGQGALHSQRAVYERHEIRRRIRLEEQHSAYVPCLRQQQRQLVYDRQSDYGSPSLPVPSPSAHSSTVVATPDSCGICSTAGKTVLPFQNCTTFRNRQTVHRNVPQTVGENNLRDGVSRTRRKRHAPSLLRSALVAAGRRRHDTAALPRHVDKLQSKYPGITIRAAESALSLRPTPAVTAGRASPEESAELARECPVCGGVFPREYSLWKHVSYFHPGSEYFECRHCGVAFADSKAYCAHLEEHGTRADAAESHPFDVHRELFTNETRQVCHEQLNSGKQPYVCEECPKRFKNKRGLIRHGTVHSGERSYVCEECPTRFKNKQSLIRHGKLHSGERAYYCDECPLLFSQKAHLTRHKKIHSGERAYSCHVCGMCFVRKDNMLVHAKRHNL